MKLGRLNHIGIAVPSLAEAAARHAQLHGAEAVGAPIEMAEQGVRLCFVDLPNGQIELLEPLGALSPIHGFLARNPAGGQHHLCYEVPAIEAAHDWFVEQGARILGPIRTGAHGTPIFFIHPKDMGGVLTEIMEAPRHG
ncbi:methylmalonyl-CoA epimerase [Sphingomonas morindae]|uniref:Methylmalonyl-CoA epimerase n=1 Tax=Sphingomonas morindae TaxID=1541170 RepID=A0ABY4X7Q8_9SPHN|nr:methylmalonyl-CoA epimerase [Sphingomonas morindae]USI72947.1 methylmalonyl-CoA epimerase [Sphingomonas morindae]